MNATLVRQKINPEKLCEFKNACTFPKEDNKGEMYIVSQMGEVYKFNESSTETVFAIDGEPISTCFDSSNYMYIADLTSKALLFKPPSLSDGSHLPEYIIAKEFEGKQFKGPACLAYNKEYNCIYFADSGRFEESTLDPFDISIYSIDLDTRVLKRILTGLSFVYDICYDNVRECLYISETFMNRIIRLKMNQDGIFHSSVFYQFNGRLGPSAMTIDDKGNLYVSRMEYQIEEEVDNNFEIDVDGLIATINQDGILLGEIIVPKMPEIAGLFISPKKKENLFFTLRNLGAIFKIKISSYSSDLEKYEATLKNI